MSMDSGSQNPYKAQYDSSPPPPAKKSNLGCILAVVGGIALVGLLVCCGGGYSLMSVGFDMMGAQATTAIRANPIANEKIGEVKSCKVDFAASAAHPENQNSDGERQIMVFNVEGTKGSGVLTAQVVDEPGQQNLKPVELRMSTGEVIKF